MWDITAEGARRAPGTENAEKITVKGLYVNLQAPCDGIYFLVFYFVS